MSLSNSAENSIALLIFNATAWANIADNAAASPATNLYVGFHTADPGEAGAQNTNETTYTSYARVAVARTSGGWTVTGNSVSPTANVDAPQCTGGTATLSHFSIGTASSGVGVLIGSGTLTPNISVSSGVTPRLSTSTTITFD